LFNRTILEEEIKENKEEQDLSEGGLARWHSPGCCVGNLSSVNWDKWFTGVFSMFHFNNISSLIIFFTHITLALLRIMSA